ncbi:hypothetical protein AX16_001507 [Volvariella volvacea WC 439]|nr:hypothetical protein AX16_001507 [Volvariella volvacea WC 439]
MTFKNGMFFSGARDFKAEDICIRQIDGNLTQINESMTIINEGPDGKTSKQRRKVTRIIVHNREDEKERGSINAAGDDSTTLQMQERCTVRKEDSESDLRQGTNEGPDVIIVTCKGDKVRDEDSRAKVNGTPSDSNAITNPNFSETGRDHPTSAAGDSDEESVFRAESRFKIRRRLRKGVKWVAGLGCTRL